MTGCLASKQPLSERMIPIWAIYVGRLSDKLSWTYTCMDEHRNDGTPMLMHWSHIFSVLSHTHTYISELQNYINSLAQDCSILISHTQERLQSCTKPLISSVQELMLSFPFTSVHIQHKSNGRNQEILVLNTVAYLKNDILNDLGCYQAWWCPGSWHRQDIIIRIMT